MALVTDQGHKVTDAARRLGINPTLIHRAETGFAQETTGQRLTADEQHEVTRLRRRVREREMETEILKKATAYFATLSK